MPRYEVRSDQGTFEVTLDQEATPEELRSLVEQRLVSEAANAPVAGTSAFPGRGLAPDEANPLTSFGTKVGEYTRNVVAPTVGEYIKNAINTPTWGQRLATPEPVLGGPPRPPVIPAWTGIPHVLGTGENLMRMAAAPLIAGAMYGPEKARELTFSLLGIGAPFAGQLGRSLAGDAALLRRPSMPPSPVPPSPVPLALGGQLASPGLRAAIADAQGLRMPELPPPGPGLPTASPFVGPGIAMPESSFAAQRFFHPGLPPEVLGPPSPPAPPPQLAFPTGALQPWQRPALIPDQMRLSFPPEALPVAGPASETGMWRGGKIAWEPGPKPGEPVIFDAFDRPITPPAPGSGSAALAEKPSITAVTPSPVPPPIVSEPEMAALMNIGKEPVLPPPSLPSSNLPTITEALGAIRQLPRERQASAHAELMDLASRFRHNLESEAGGAKLGFTVPLAGGAVGAATGGMLGDTPAEKIGGAALGALAGFALMGMGTAALSGIGAPATTALERRMAILNATPAAAGLSGRVASAAKAAMQTTGLGSRIPWPAPRTAIANLAQASDPAFSTAFTAELAKRGLTPIDAGRILMDDPAVKPQRLLRQTAAFGKFVWAQAESGNIAAQRLISAARAESPTTTVGEMMANLGRRDINILRASLTTAWRTLSRNTVVQQGVVGLEQIGSLMDAAMAKSLGLGHLSTVGFTQAARYAGDYWAGVRGYGAEMAANAMRAVGRDAEANALMGSSATRPARLVNQLAAAWPTEKNALYQRYMSDVLTKSEFGRGFIRGEGGRVAPVATETQAGLNQLYNGLETGVSLANLPNRTAEFTTRSGLFYAEATRGLRGIGLDPYALNIARDGDRIGPIVAQSVEKALRDTFASTPRLDAASWTERTMAKWINSQENSLVQKSFLQVFLGLYFPRFTWNAGRFLWNRPFGSTIPAFRTLTEARPDWLGGSAAQRAAVTAGDVRSVTEAAQGAAMFFAGYEIAKNMPGDRVTDIKIPGWGQLSILPFSPLSAYVFVPRVIIEAQNGTLNRHIPDVIRSAQQMSGRIGQTVGSLDTILEAWAKGDMTALDRSTRGVQRFIGDTGAGVLQPLTTAQNLYATYGQYLPMLQESAAEEAKQRDVTVNPMTDPFVARMPLASQLLPERRQWLTPGPILREEPPKILGVPVSAEFVGAVFRNPTSAESEARRLGMKFSEIGGVSTGDPRADLLMRATGSDIAFSAIEPLIASKAYLYNDNGLPRDDVDKALIFAKTMEMVRRITNSVVMQHIGTKPREQWTPDEVAFVSMKVKGMLAPRLRDMIKGHGGVLP